MFEFIKDFKNGKLTLSRLSGKGLTEVKFLPYPTLTRLTRIAQLP
jgi:hypothetical protein